MTDEKIVERVIAGDTEAYGQIMHRYETKLLRYVTYLIHDKVAAQDVVQNTFIKTYQHLRRFNRSYKFSSWIYRIAHNEAMNAIKQQRHHSDADITEQPDDSYSTNLESAIDAGIAKAHLHGCLGKLEPKYREVLQLVYLERMKYEEASDVLHIPTSTVGVWLSRAKAKLRTICEQKGVHP